MQSPIFVLLMVVQSFFACQRAQEMTSNRSLDPQNAQKKPVPTAAGIIFKSSDGGQTWQDISDGLPENFQASSILVDGGDVLLGTENGFYRSGTNPTAPDWQKELLVGERITDMFPGRGGLYLCNGGRGIFQKLGRTGLMVPKYDALQGKPAFTILETPDGGVFVGTDNGIFKSADGGETWKQVSSEGWVMNLVRSGGVLIGSGAHGILRSTDNGENWDWVISEGGVGIRTTLIDGGFAAITYNTATKTRRMRTSTDGGKTWQAIDGDLLPTSQLADIKQAGEFLFCSHPDGIFRSADRGKTWQLVRLCESKASYLLAVSGKTVYAVRVFDGC